MKIMLVTKLKADKVPFNRTISGIPPAVFHNLQELFDKVFCGDFLARMNGVLKCGSVEMFQKSYYNFFTVASVKSFQTGIKTCSGIILEKWEGRVIILCWTE